MEGRGIRDGVQAAGRSFSGNKNQHFIRLGSTLFIGYCIIDYSIVRAVFIYCWQYCCKASIYPCGIGAASHCYLTEPILTPAYVCYIYNYVLLLAIGRK
jgi:hypothetical protein